MKYEKQVAILVRAFYIAPLENGARNCKRDGYTQSAAKYLAYACIISNYIESMSYGFLQPQECLEICAKIYQRSKETMPPIIQQEFERISNGKDGTAK